MSFTNALMALIMLGVPFLGIAIAFRQAVYARRPITSRKRLKHCREATYTLKHDDWVDRISKVIDDSAPWQRPHDSAMLFANYHAERSTSKASLNLFITSLGWLQWMRGRNYCMARMLRYHRNRQAVWLGAKRDLRAMGVSAQDLRITYMRV